MNDLQHTTVCFSHNLTLFPILIEHTPYMDKYRNDKHCEGESSEVKCYSGESGGYEVQVCQYMGGRIGKKLGV
jgi:hypothetical protein